MEVHGRLLMHENIHRVAEGSLLSAMVKLDFCRRIRRGLVWRCAIQARDRPSQCMMPSVFQSIFTLREGDVAQIGL